MAIAVVPISLWLALFSYEILELWTRNSELASQAAGALSVLALGTMLNAFMNMPYAMQLAHSYTHLALMQNIIAVIFMAPLTWYLATHYNLTAAALPWFLVNAGYVVFGMPLMHRYLALQGLRDWYFKSILKPVIYAGGGMAFVKIIWTTLLGQQIMIALMFITLSVGLLMGLWGSQLITVERMRQWKNIL